MKHHVYSDDVAITWAKNKKEAIKIFQQLYDYSKKELYPMVDKVKFHKNDASILTDY